MRNTQTDQGGHTGTIVILKGGTKEIPKALIRHVRGKYRTVCGAVVILCSATSNVTRRFKSFTLRSAILRCVYEGRFSKSMYFAINTDTRIVLIIVSYRIAIQTLIVLIIVSYRDTDTLIILITLVRGGRRPPPHHQFESEPFLNVLFWIR